MKTFMSLLLVLALSIWFVSAAFAAPSTLSMQNYSAAGQTNYAASCAVVGVLDKSDKINDNDERINLASLRTFSLTKGGLANYSTSLHTKGSQFKIVCVRATTGADNPVKLFFDRVSAYWVSVTSGIFRFY